jgi:hypothetical protein
VIRTGARGPSHPLAGLLTVMWHYVRTAAEEPRVGESRVEPAAFDAQLDRIGRARTVVGWTEVADALAGERPLPPDAALLTFDDGLVDHHRTVGPRLAARGWTGIFFTTARRPGDRLSVGHRIHVLRAEWSDNELRACVAERLTSAARARLADAELRERDVGADPVDVLKRTFQRDLAAVVGPILSVLIEERHGPEPDVADALLLSTGQVAGLRRAGMTIGGHGRRHLWFDHASPRRMLAEVAASAAFLAPEPKPWAFAYPYGNGAPDGPTALAAAGFAAAFHASPLPSLGRYDLGRVDAAGPLLDEALAPSTAHVIAR